MSNNNNKPPPQHIFNYNIGSTARAAPSTRPAVPKRINVFATPSNRFTTLGASRNTSSATPSRDSDVLWNSNDVENKLPSTARAVPSNRPAVTKSNNNDVVISSNLITTLGASSNTRSATIFNYNSTARAVPSTRPPVTKSNNNDVVISSNLITTLGASSNTRSATIFNYNSTARAVPSNRPPVTKSNNNDVVISSNLITTLGASSNTRSATIFNYNSTARAVPSTRPPVTKSNNNDVVISSNRITTLGGSSNTSSASSSRDSDVLWNSNDVENKPPSTTRAVPSTRPAVTKSINVFATPRYRFTILGASSNTSSATPSRDSDVLWNSNDVENKPPSTARAVPSTRPAVTKSINVFATPRYRFTILGASSNTSSATPSRDSDVLWNSNDVENKPPSTARAVPSTRPAVTKSINVFATPSNRVTTLGASSNTSSASPSRDSNVVVRQESDLYIPIDCWRIDSENSLKIANTPSTVSVKNKNSFFDSDDEIDNKYEIHYNDKRVFTIPEAPVTMPTGQIVSVTIPAEPKCLCKTHSDPVLIHLGPQSRTPSPEYDIICEEMNNTIRQHVSGSYSRHEIISIHRITNCCLWTKFRNRQFDMGKEGIDLNERMLFHGSSVTEEILKRGFDERHSNQSGMFGAGIYFAEHSSKSNQYVFGYMGGNGCSDHSDKRCGRCVRKMLLCRVTLGKTKQLTSANKMAHAPPGYHSVVGQPTASGLQYPEYVIYRGEQAYPEYLISYRIII